MFPAISYGFVLVAADFVMSPVEVTSQVSFTTQLLSVLLLAAGLGIIFYLIALVYSAFNRSFGGVLERTAFRRHSLRCRRGDQLVEQGDLAGAVQVFGTAFFLKPIRRDSSLLSDIGNYHTGLLSRLLTIADEMDKGRARLPSLADADRLLTERLELHLAYFQALKRENGERARAVEQRLRQNEGEVRAAVNQLITEIRSSEERVLYH